MKITVSTIFLSYLCLQLCQISLTNALPMQLVVNPRMTECLYEQLDENESATISAFILSGPELKAELLFQGPLAPSDVDNPTFLADAVAKFDRGDFPRSDKTVLFSTIVDFEHLSLGEYDEDEGAEEEDEGTVLSAEDMKQRRGRERKRVLESRYKKEQHHIKQKRYVRDEGEAFQKTFRVNVAGWYRFCVRATWFQVTAEIDFRKQSELGGLNQRGHVYTFEEQAMADEELLMEKDSAAEEGIKDEDFLATKEKLKQLRRLLADIEAKQKQERHRLIVHAATNEHSHSRMVLGSLLETIVFMAVTGIQIMTIRRWFKGAPVLGR